MDLLLIYASFPEIIDCTFAQILQKKFSYYVSFDENPCLFLHGVSVPLWCSNWSYCEDQGAGHGSKFPQPHVCDSLGLRQKQFG